MGFLQRLMFSILGNSVIFWWLTMQAFPDVFKVSGGITGYFLIAVVFGLLNFLIKPILSLVTLPIRWITLGLFSFIFNAAILWLLEQSMNFLQLLDTALTIEGWLTYVIAGAILAAFNAVLHWFER